MKARICTRVVVVALAACMSGAALFGCQAQDTSSTTSDTQTMVIGQAGATSQSFTLANSSGKSVVSMAVSAVDAADYSENLMTSDAHLKNGETATIYIPDGTLVNGATIVDVKVVFGDGGVSVLHYLDLADFDTATLLLDGKIGYVTYQSTAAARMVSTLELQTYYYNLEDPTAAARDGEEEAEEKRRLEKLEEDLKSTEQSTSTETEEDEEDAENVQGADIEDDPIEVNYEDTSDD